MCAPHDGREPEATMIVVSSLSSSILIISGGLEGGCCEGAKLEGMCLGIGALASF